MNAQLAAVVESFESATRRLQVLGASLSPEEWSRRPGAGRWSPIECVAHLNLTASAMLPLVRDGIERARALGRPGPRRYRRDLMGWLLARGLSTPGRFKSKTTPAFVPPSGVRVPDVLDEFGRLQAEQIACARESDGLPVDRVKVASPFNARVRYSVYSALALAAVHEHRHLWQAEQARLELSRPGEF
jgi:hypothetical protein